MEVKGKIVKINETKIVSDKFKNREFVVVTAEQYPQYISMQVTQDKCSLLDKYKVGDSVECAINLRGREYTKNSETKYFNSIECWKINKVEGSGEERPTIDSSATTDDSGLPF